jgi:hypothetical protein
MVDLELHPNEASDLALVPVAVDRFDQTFVTVLDEGVIEESIAVLGHRGDDVSTGWEAIRLSLTPTGSAGKTEDAEACDFFGEHLYVLGSHFGKKDGPLEAKRAWIARVAAADLAAAANGASPPIEIARNRFGLHRALNDHLSGLELRALGARARENLVLATIERGVTKGKSWAGKILDADQPINIEGCCFLEDGTLLLGLRTPVTADGLPILVALHDLAAYFEEPDSPPTLGDVWTLTCGGTRERPMGVRALQRTADGRVHAIVGSLDALGKDSALVFDDKDAGAAHCEHWTFTLPPGGGAVECVKTHEFPDERSVEGLAKMPSGPFLYVVDRDDNVHLRFLMTEEES